jgi:hypothetical protein
MSSPDRRRIRLRRWIRLVIGILNAKAPIACAGQLALLPRCEPAVLGTTHPTAVVSGSRIDNHGDTWPCTCGQCEDDPGHQTHDAQDSHWGSPGECCVCSTAHTLGNPPAGPVFQPYARPLRASHRPPPVANWEIRARIPHPDSGKPAPRVPRQRPLSAPGPHPKLTHGRVTPPSGAPFIIADAHNIRL